MQTLVRLTRVPLLWLFMATFCYSGEPRVDQDEKKVVVDLDVLTFAKTIIDSARIERKGMDDSGKLLIDYNIRTKEGNVVLSVRVFESVKEAENPPFPLMAQIQAQPIAGLGGQQATGNGFLLNDRFVVFSRRNVGIMLEGLPAKDLIKIAEQIDAKLITGGDGVNMGDHMPPVTVECPIPPLGPGEEVGGALLVRLNDKAVEDFDALILPLNKISASHDPSNPHRIILKWPRSLDIREPQKASIWVALPNGRIVNKTLNINLKAQK